MNLSQLETLNNHVQKDAQLANEFMNPDTTPERRKEIIKEKEQNDKEVMKGIDLMNNLFGIK